MLLSWLPAGGAGCLAGRALPLPTQAACLSLQEEEEEDIDNLVEIHRQRVARGSMRSGTSSVSPHGTAVPCSTGRNDGEGHGWLVGWEGSRAGSSWDAGARAWGVGASSPRSESKRGDPALFQGACVGVGGTRRPSPATEG